MSEVHPVMPEVEDGRAEVAAVLSSSMFQRSARSAKLLRYLSEKYFAGQTAEIKEYNIALDVLGRPETFDPAEDAGARVEVHRLRKKLKEYYESEGRHHRFQVVIPTGTYIPVFVRTDEHAEVEVPAMRIIPPLAMEPPIAVAAEQHAPAGGRRRFLTLAVVAALSSGATWTVLHFQVPDTAVQAIAPGHSHRGLSAPVPTGPQIRLLCGRGETLTDAAGFAWMDDRYFSDGEAGQNDPARIHRTRTPAIFAGRRSGNFNYDIPLAPGYYELRLYFVETEYGPGMPNGGGENSRLFHVIANGRRILSDFDILGDAGGPEIADIRVFKDIQPDSDGKLHLRFLGAVGPATVNAIELTPARPHLQNPIRMSPQDSVFMDREGNRWLPDDYRTGGRTATHSIRVLGARDSGLFQTELYGRFRYSIPVAPTGRYDLVLHVAEMYWGPENQGGGGPGARVFDVFCNGAALARNIDIYAQNGGNRALELRYESLKPNAQGKLDIDFLPVKNYASLFGIEVFDVSE